MNNSDFLFNVSIDNIKYFISMIKSIQFKEVAIIFITNNGMKISVNDSKFCQANSFIQADFFKIYEVVEEPIIICANLNILLECLILLNDFLLSIGLSSDIQMYYSRKGGPIILLFKNMDMELSCSVKTLDIHDQVDLMFPMSNIVNKVIITSDCLKDAINILDLSSEVFELSFSEKESYLRLSTNGLLGNAQLQLPKECDMIEQFSCTTDQTLRYKISLLKIAIKALVVSSKTSIRVEESGVLSMQFMIVSNTGNISFTEYLCSPDVDIDE